MRLDITRKTNLAILAMAALQRPGGRIPGKELAAEVGTSTAFLAQVMMPLVRRGWVTSQPGRSGGYELTNGVSDVSVLEVIEAIEGPTDTTSCVLRSGDCTAAKPCAAHEAWSRARNALINELAGTPLTVLSAQGDVR